MTLIGQNFIDLFFASLDSKSQKTNKRIITERESEILKKYYDFESNQFQTFDEIGQFYELSRERIRQLHNRSLKRLKYAGKQLVEADNPSVKLRRVLKEAIDFIEGENNTPKLINFWEENLSDFPGEIIVRLISNLLYSRENEINRSIAFFKEWKKEQIEREKKQLLKKFREEKNETKILKQQDSILEKVIWFEKRKKWKDVNIEKLIPKRKVNNTSEFISGIFESKKSQRDIQYESGLELKFILLMENFQQIKFYFEQPTTIYYQRKNIDFKYTPDFVIFLENSEAVIVEIKDFTGMVDIRVQRKVEALIDYCKLYGFGLLLTNGHSTINYLLSKNCNHDFENEILRRLNENGGRTIFYREFLELQTKFKILWIDFLSMVLKNNLGFYPFRPNHPFKLTLKNNCNLFRETMIK